MVRIGINLLYLLPGVNGGTETYASGLLHGLDELALSEQLFIFVNEEAADWPLPLANNITRVVCPVRATDRGRRYRFEQFSLPQLLKKKQIDLIHSLGYVGPLFPGCPAVVTVPDLNYTVFGKQMTLVRKLSLQFFVGQSVRRADKVVTISEFARQQILKYFSMSGERVVTIHLAPRLRTPSTFTSTSNWLRDKGIESRYVVAFSSGSPNKNMPRLIQAFTLAKTRKSFDHQLVLIGHMPKEGMPAVMPPDVHCTGFLSDDDVQLLLRGAEFMLFPSTYEGFGLPALEAMAVGVPIVCSTAASLPEVAGDAALYIDPLSVEDMAEKIDRMTTDTDLKNDLRKKGFFNLARFSWIQTARQTRQVWQDVLGYADDRNITGSNSISL